MKWWNNGVKHTRSEMCPGEGWVQGRIYSKRKPLSADHKKNLSEKLTGRTPWNKGKPNAVSDETRKRMSESAKQRSSNGILPDNKGKPPWNKGKTKETDQSVFKYASSQRGQTRNGRYPKGEEHHNFNYKKTEYDEYSYQVWKVTHKQDISLLENYDKPRGRAGVEGAYQLDHIISIKYGFDNDIDPRVIGDLSNLQIITWQENRKKWK